VVANVPLRRETSGSPWREHALDLQHLDAVNLCLGGHSALDLYRLRFPGRADVRRFFRASLADPADPFDRERLIHLHQEALDHLHRQFGDRLPAAVTAPDRVEDLLLLASGDGEYPRRRLTACAVLKVMHLIDHLEARTLGQRLALDEGELARAVLGRLDSGVHRARRAGAPIVAAEGGRKDRDAELTKLLLRRDAASSIADRVRFRVITETRDDIVPVLAWMLRDHVPFNQVLARESVNSLVSLREWLDARSGLRDLLDSLQLPPADDAVEGRQVNRFSGPDFLIVNFVVEAPVRADRLASQVTGTFDPALGRIVYVPTELQLVDRATHARNDEGPRAHVHYKARQLDAASRRLRRGAVGFPRELSVDDED